MTKKELIKYTIEKLSDLKRIKEANCGVKNEELDNQIILAEKELEIMGIDIKEFGLWVKVEVKYETIRNDW